MQTDTLIEKSGDAAGLSPGETAVSRHNKGIEILRIWLCFGVILYHFYRDGSCAGFLTDIISYPRWMAVPVFMLISFILLSYKFATRTVSFRDICGRCNRLAIPIVFWAFAYFVGFRISQWAGIVDTEVTWWHLSNQLFLGHSYNYPMWFMNVLLFLTIIWGLVFVIPGKKPRMAVLAVLAAVSFYLQYSGIYWDWFNPLGWEERYPLGRLIEMMPYMCVGSMIGMYGLHRISRIELWIPLSLATGVMVLTRIENMLPTANSFGYGGLTLLILSVSFASVFILFPSGIFRGEGWLAKGIVYVSRYTMGIYCLHVMLGNLIANIRPKLFPSVGDYICCVMVFVVGLGICLLIDRLPLKWLRHTVS